MGCCMLSVGGTQLDELVHCRMLELIMYVVKSRLPREMASLPIKLMKMRDTWIWTGPLVCIYAGIRGTRVR